LRPTPQSGGSGPCIYTPKNRVAQLHPQARGSLSIAFYDSQGYGGGILTHLHTGTNLYNPLPNVFQFVLIAPILYRGIVVIC
jgi:hypothetical protein